jgi:hypothetical protein
MVWFYYAGGAVLGLLGLLGDLTFQNQPKKHHHLTTLPQYILIRCEA